MTMADFDELAQTKQKRDIYGIVHVSSGVSVLVSRRVREAQASVCFRVCNLDWVVDAEAK